jgi:hypothetical protein
VSGLTARVYGIVWALWALGWLLGSLYGLSGCIERYGVECNIGAELLGAGIFYFVLVIFAPGIGWIGLRRPKRRPDLLGEVWHRLVDWHPGQLAIFILSALLLGGAVAWYFLSITDDFPKEAPALEFVAYAACALALGISLMAAWKWLGARNRE